MDNRLSTMDQSMNGIQTANPTAETTLFSAAERWQSVKVGGVGAIALGGFTGLRIVLHAALGEHGVGAIALGVALLSGGLFGITYRYVVRTDRNPQLKTGTIMAFGLVRGLAGAEVGFSQASLWQLGLYGGESVMGFAIAAAVVEWGFQRGWLQPFGPAISTEQWERAIEPEGDQDAVL